MSYIYKLSDDVAPSLHNIFKEKGWTEWNSKKHEENEWNILFTTKRHFTLSSSYSLSAFQKLNHFKRTSQITKKDHLTRNLKRMRANFGKIYNFYPKTYQFPLQYSEFVTMTKQRNNASSNHGLTLSSNGNIQSLSINKMLKRQKSLLSSNKYIKKSKAIESETFASNTVWIAKPCCGRRGENISFLKIILHFVA